MDIDNSYTFSEHAIQRAIERFPWMTLKELERCAQRSKVARNKLKKKIGEACPQAYPLFMSGAFKDRYYLYNRGRNIVFVVGNGNNIITIFYLEYRQDKKE